MTRGPVDAFSLRAALWRSRAAYARLLGLAALDPRALDSALSADLETLAVAKRRQASPAATRPGRTTTR